METIVNRAPLDDFKRSLVVATICFNKAQCAALEGDAHMREYFTIHMRKRAKLCNELFATLSAENKRILDLTPDERWLLENAEKI